MPFTEKKKKHFESDHAKGQRRNQPPKTTNKPPRTNTNEPLSKPPTNHHGEHRTPTANLTKRLHETPWGPAAHMR